MSRHNNLTSLFTDIATAMRNKFGLTGQIKADDFDITIDSITKNTDSGNVTLDSTTISKSYPAGYYTNVHGAQHSTVSRADTTISKSADTTNKEITFTASNNQGTGYVTGANKTATATATLSVSGKTATMTDGTNSVTADVNLGTITASGSKQQSTPTFSLSGTTLTATVASTSGTTTPSVSSAGYISSSEGTKTNGTFTMSANSANYTIPTEDRVSSPITANGTYNATSGKFWQSVKVAIPTYSDLS